MMKAMLNIVSISAAGIPLLFMSTLSAVWRWTSLHRRSQVVATVAMVG